MKKVDHEFHRPEFQLVHVRYLYEQACDFQRMRDQWKSPESLHLALQYQNKLEAVVELMENIVVFHVGMGFDMDSYNVDERLKSFKYLFKGKK